MLQNVQPWAFLNWFQCKCLSSRVLTLVPPTVPVNSFGRKDNVIYKPIKLFVIHYPYKLHQTTESSQVTINMAVLPSETCYRCQHKFWVYSESNHYWLSDRICLSHQLPFLLFWLLAICFLSTEYSPPQESSCFRAPSLPPHCAWMNDIETHHIVQDWHSRADKMHTLYYKLYAFCYFWLKLRGMSGR